jgi:outer membrane protein TolC
VGEDGDLPPESGVELTQWTVNVGFSWEVDLWGRVRRLSETHVVAQGRER